MLQLLLLIATAWQTAEAQPRQLFNGKDLDGWAFLGREGPAEPVGFTVENGMIRTVLGKGMLWYTREKIADATLRIVYKMTNEKGNSGIFIRIPDKPRNEWDAIH